MSADVQVIIAVVDDAYRRRVPLAQAALDRIASNRQSLRVWRTRPVRSLGFIEMRERVCRRILADNRRTRRLIKTYASWRAAEVAP